MKTQQSQRSIELIAPSYREHVMLLCKDQLDCNLAAIEAINDALKSGHLCIYASVLNGDSAHLTEIASAIPNFNAYIERGELVIIDIKAYVEAALQSNLTPRDELKERMELLIQQRLRSGKSDKIVIFGDGAFHLANKRHFDKCVDLETWWNDVHAQWINKKFNITIICPHPAEVLNAEPSLTAKKNIAHVHSLTLELAKLRKTRNSAQEMRILIVEPEPDIQAIYLKYFEKLDSIKTTVVATGKEALEKVMSGTDDGFDLIILDSHLKDASAIEVARKIITTIPDQRITFTTTSSVAQMKADIRSIRLSSEEVLEKPFTFGNLLALIRAKNQH